MSLEVMLPFGGSGLASGHHGKPAGTNRSDAVRSRGAVCSSVASHAFCVMPSASLRNWGLLIASSRSWEMWREGQNWIDHCLVCCSCPDRVSVISQLGGMQRAVFLCFFYPLTSHYCTAPLMPCCINLKKQISLCGPIDSYLAPEDSVAAPWGIPGYLCALTP